MAKKEKRKERKKSLFSKLHKVTELVRTNGSTCLTLRCMLALFHRIQVPQIISPPPQKLVSNLLPEESLELKASSMVGKHSTN